MKTDTTLYEIYAELNLLRVMLNDEIEKAISDLCDEQEEVLAA